jgi:hypothetical protein
VPFRQLLIVLLALIAIVGASLFVLSWGDDSADTSAETDIGDADDDQDELDTTTSSTTTTTAPVNAPIPVDCGIDDATTTTTSTIATSPDDGEPADDDGADEPDLPLIPTLGPNSSLSTVGLDKVTFGLTLRAATQAAGTEFHPCGPVNDCYRVTAVDAPSGISFLVHEGTIERIDIVGDSPITTVSGAGIGTTADELDGLFGDRLERVDLAEGVVDAIFVPTSENDAEFRVAFTTVDGVVETLRAGRVPLVLEADPCGA